jgi:hypothetical protein
MRPPMINYIFACAMIENCSLAEAAVKCDANKDDLQDAYRFRLDTAHRNNPAGRFIDDYRETITESFKRLEMMN